MASSFEVLEGFPKGVSGDVLAMEWCPTMDLLALVTSDSQVAVHRTTWQRLFLISGLDSPVCCVTWRPDGQLLAAGHADGSVTMYTVEDGELFHTVREHSAALTLFSWISATAEPHVADSPYVSSIAGLFAPLPLLPRGQPMHDDEPPQLDAQLYKLLFDGHDALPFEIALTADVESRIHLAVHGRFSLGSLCLGELPALSFDGKPPGARIVLSRAHARAAAHAAATPPPPHRPRALTPRFFRASQSSHAWPSRPRCTR